MRGALLLILSTLFPLLLAGHLKPCKYWCKTSEHRYYCCPAGKSESQHEHGWHSFVFPWFWIGFGTSHFNPMPHSMSWQETQEVEAKPKRHCPPLRAHCPRSSGWYPSPSFCDNDHDCSEWEKCCYDVCLEHKTCKPSE